METPWDAVVCFLLIMLTLAACLMTAKAIRSQQKRALLLGLYHILFTFMFVFWSWNETVDAKLYFESAKQSDIPLGLGTHAIALITSFVVRTFDLGYLNANLLFSAFSAVGLILIDKVIQDTTRNATAGIRFIGLLFIFLPSLHFWSACIGKDAIVVLGLGLVIWALQDTRNRLVYFSLGILLVFVARAHIGGLILIAMAIMSCFERSIPVLWRLTTTALTAVVFSMSISVIQARFGLVGADYYAIIAYIENHQTQNLGGGSSVDIASLSVPMRVFTYLFRPTVFEITNFLSLVSAIENLILLIIFIALVVKVVFKPRVSPMFKNRPVLLLYGLLCLFLLSQTTANLGLAMRQKWMVVPILFLLLVSYVSVRVGAATHRPQSGLPYHNDGN